MPKALERCLKGKPTNKPQGPPTVPEGLKGRWWALSDAQGKLYLCEVSSGIMGEGMSVVLSYEKYMNLNVMGSFQPSQTVVIRSQRMAWP